MHPELPELIGAIDEIRGKIKNFKDRGRIHGKRKLYNALIEKLELLENHSKQKLGNGKPVPEDLPDAIAITKLLIDLSSEDGTEAKNATRYHRLSDVYHALSQEDKEVTRVQLQSRRS